METHFDATSAGASASVRPLNRMPRRLPVPRWHAAVLVAAACLLAPPADAQSVDEYQFKSAFVYNVASFVSWPADAFGSTDGPLAICLLGDSPVSAMLEHAPARSVEKRRLVVREVSNAADMRECQVLFIAAPALGRWRVIAATLRDRFVLTVGESDGFADQEGIINLKVEKDRVRIQVNVEAADAKGLRISSKLLTLSQIVKPGR
jgi:hypothetical protein